MVLYNIESVKNLTDGSYMVYWIKRIFKILFAVTIISISINLFLGPHHIAAGGLTGLAIILEAAFGIDRSIVVFAFNLVILVLTYMFLGKKVFTNTVIGAMSLPVIMGVIPHATFIQDVMLSVIIGSALFGIGVGILFINHASSGGTTIPPLIMQKYFNLNPSIGLFFTDSLVVLLTLFVFDIEEFFFAIFSIFITTVTMRYMESGLNRKKMVFILSEKKKEIMEELLHKVKRGVTVVPVVGAYTGQKMEMLMVTLNSRDYQELMTVVDKYDNKAFIITSTVSDVHGLGFTYESGSV